LLIRISLEVQKEGDIGKSSIDVDWTISRSGVIKAVMC